VHLGLVYDFPSPIFRSGMRFIDMAMAPSHHTADGWRGRDWPARSLRVIPNGVDTRTFCPGLSRKAARDHLAISVEKSPLIAYVGRLVPEKGILTLTRAFASYRRSGGEGHLMFVGPAPAGEVLRLRDAAREEGLPDAAWEVRPSTPTPEDVYRAADLVVVPSEWDEPFGLVPVEAMACGTLAIVSDRGGLPRFVAPLNGDAVFAAADPESLGARLHYWLSDPDRREAAAARMASHARAHFSFEPCGDAYLAAFEEALRR
jgi:glycosyltransferase involved in cell wall biosynthesis